MGSLNLTNFSSKVFKNAGKCFLLCAFSSTGVRTVNFFPSVSNPDIWDRDAVFWAAAFPAQLLLEYFFEFLLAVHYLGHGALARSPWALLSSSPFLAGGNRISGKEKKHSPCATRIKEKWSFYCCKLLLISSEVWSLNFQSHRWESS